MVSVFACPHSGHVRVEPKTTAAMSLARLQGRREPGVGSRLHERFGCCPGRVELDDGKLRLEVHLRDLDAWHLLGRAHGALQAYARLLRPGAKFAEASIGRVITAREARGTGLGRTLMGEAVARAGQLWPGQPIRIGAQARLERFYEGFGFRRASSEYIEDGIPHIEMLRA